MRSLLLSAAFAASCLLAPSTAQEMRGFAMSGNRHSTTLAIFSSDFSSAAMATLSHGQPEWHDKYTAMLDKFHGTTQRLGANWWTTLMNTTTLELGGAKIEPGCWCLAVHIDDHGELSLVMINAGKAMMHGLMPFFPNTWKPDHTAHLKLHKNATDKAVERMTMTFAADQEHVGHGTLTIAWGPHELTADAVLHQPKK